MHKPHLIPVTFLAAWSACTLATASPSHRTVRDTRAPSGQVVVISDVDDTIKATGVTVGRTHIKNLPWILLDPIRPWRPVAGMPGLYRRIQRNMRAQFMYVSKGPTFNHRRLQDNLARYGFPIGPIILNSDFPSAAGNYKFVAITPIIQSHPRRHYILFGDSGEADPENYGMLARKFPGQIDRIYIHSVTADWEGRYRAAFHDVPHAKWEVYASPQDLHF